MSTDGADRARGRAVRPDADPRDQAGRPRRAGVEGRLRRHRGGLDHVPHQLRHRLAAPPDASRRTIFRKGPARCPTLPGEPWHSCALPARLRGRRRARVVCVKPDGDGCSLVTTYDLDDEAFAAAEARWDAWSSQRLARHLGLAHGAQERLRVSDPPEQRLDPRADSPRGCCGRARCRSARRCSRSTPSIGDRGRPRR